MTKRTREWRIVAFAAALSFAFTTTSLAVAHSGGSDNFTKWAGDSVGFHWDPDVGAGAREAINDPRSRWNELAADFSILNFGEGEEIPGEWDDCDEFVAGQNYVSFEAMPESQYNGYDAWVWICDDPFPRTAQMRFRNDSSTDWQIYETSPLEANEMDLRSAAAHEWGHFTGWVWGPTSGGHFAEGGDYCGGSSLPRHTMCPRWPDGTTMMRSLEDHDKHTLNNAYP